MLARGTLCLVLLSLPAAFSEIYSSIESVKNAWVREKVALQDALDFLNGFDVSSIPTPYNIHSLDGFKRFIAETNETHMTYDEEDSMEAYLRHPIHIYHFIKRCVDDWRFHTQHLLYISEEKHVMDYVDRLNDMFEQDNLWPRRGDLTAASLGLIRLHRTYEFSFDEMAGGNINGIPSEPLTVEDMYNIALVGVDNWRPWSALKWILAVSQRLRAGEVGGPSATSYEKVRLKLAELFDKFGNYHLAARAAETIPRTDAEREFFKELITYYKNRNATNSSNNIVPHKQFSTVHSTYERYCRGDIPEKPANVTQHLRCFTRPSAVPYHLAKIEVLHINPNIYMFHDVVYEGEQQEIKQMAKERLVRSTVAAAEGFSRIADYRISETAWLDKEEDTVLPKVFKRVQQLSGFRVDELDGKPGSENLQVLNYGIGGMYGPHADFLRKYPDEKFYLNKGEGDDEMSQIGDRIATWMFYLNDVEYGGATVFPIAGARVLPVKGSATLWYNLNRDGDPDVRTLHAGCPVAIGSKWLGNIWFRYNQQAFNKRCLPGNEHAL
ncbi:prolyl 4-hydroxylase subunit alpha-2-like [Lineus longissimus]|uniref:prolyl 4-hydroxylase subunit alpha-2-like n=1 Tax=Lineus longissimus TaxID=88925 RepID=UPI002B4CC61D